jgi:hypothetical protein
MMITEEVDLEKLVREHENRKRILAAFFVPVLLVGPSVGADVLTAPVNQPPGLSPA